MAINPESQYPGKINPSSPAYPYGSARNITTPGDGTGTPWEAAIVNDSLGFQQALLALASLVPTGTPDQVGASQYLQALQKIGILKWSDEPTYQIGAIVIGSDNELYQAKVSQSNNDPVGDNETNWRRFLAPEGAVDQTQKIMARLEADIGDAIMLVVGDSTGNETTEWVYLLLQDRAARS